MIVFHVLPVAVERGELVATGTVTREEIPASSNWEAIEKRWTGEGLDGGYSTRRTVKDYPKPYAIIERSAGWVALYPVP